MASFLASGCACLSLLTKHLNQMFPIPTLMLACRRVSTQLCLQINSFILATIIQYILIYFPIFDETKLNVHSILILLILLLFAWTCNTTHQHNKKSDITTPSNSTDKLEYT